MADVLLIVALFSLVFHFSPLLGSIYFFFRIFSSHHFFATTQLQLCNKCGLFERTHSRPRPEQFPHKRGPIVTTSFKSTRDPSQTHRVGAMTPVVQSHTPPVVPPHQYDHPSIAPLVNRQDSISAPVSVSHMNQNGRVNSNHGGHSPGGTPPELRNILNAEHAQVNGSALDNGHAAAAAAAAARTNSARTTPHQSPKVEQRTPPQI